MTYGQCPKCLEQCWLDVVPPAKEPNLVEIVNRNATKTDYGDGEDWEEKWHCPKCGCEWFEANGYP